MKNIFKKSISIVSAAVLALTLGACGASTSPSSDASSGGAAPSADALHVGIIQLAENGAFTDMREGFISRMRDLGYDESKMAFDYKNAQGDVGTLNTICQEMADAKPDFIVAIATPSAQAIVNMNTGIPVFFISVSNPVGAGVITDMSKPDKNATGTSNAIPVDEMFKLADQLTPGVKTYGILYNTSEVNSVTTVESAKEYLTGKGIAFKEAVVTSSSEVQQAAQSLVGDVDAIFVPNDSVIQSALPQVAEVAKDAKIPVYGSSAVMVQSGAFATVSISDPEIGAITADMAKQYLDGKAIEEIPSIVVTDFTTVINKTTADAIGVTLSPEVQAGATLLD